MFRDFSNASCLRIRGLYHSVSVVPMKSAGPRAGTYHSISVVPMKPACTCLCHAMSAGPRAGTADRNGAGSCGHTGELRRCHVLHPHEEHPSGRVGQDHRHQLQGRMLVWSAGGCRMVFTYLLRSYWNTESHFAAQSLCVCCFRIFHLRRFLTFWKKLIFLEKIKLEITFVCVLLPF